MSADSHPQSAVGAAWAAHPFARLAVGGQLVPRIRDRDRDRERERVRVRVRVRVRGRVRVRVGLGSGLGLGFGSQLVPRRRLVGVACEAGHVVMHVTDPRAGELDLVRVRVRARVRVRLGVSSP